MMRRALLALALLAALGLAAPAARAAVTVTATGTEKLSADGIATYTYTGLTVPTGQSNTALVVLASFGTTSDAGVVSGVTATWNGTAIPTAASGTIPHTGTC